MSGIGTRMYRDALGTEPLYGQSGTYHVGEIAAARVAQNGDLIDVYAEFCHGSKKPFAAAVADVADAHSLKEYAPHGRQQINLLCSASCAIFAG